jgi:hypothetical protein
MRIFRFGMGVAVAATLVACEPPLEPVADTGLDLPAPSFAVVGPVVQQVTGAASFHRTTRAGVTYRHIGAFTAQRYADGSVAGMYSGNGLFGPYRGRIHCFTVIGHEAWMGVIVERSKNPQMPPGTPRVVYVMDNGEGANALPDRSTAFPPLGITLLPDLDTYCALTPEIRASSVFDLEAGNIQILP